MIRKVVLLNSMIAFLLAAVLVAYPTVRAWLNLRDPALQSGGVPELDWRIMRHLTPRYEAWAKNRVTNGSAVSLSTNNISGTEWPLFGSVFYLWAVENLEDAWSHDGKSGIDPKEYCKDAIVAASELVIDTNQAAWVRTHWGMNYLHHEDVFYRMLVMAALTSRANLLHDHAHLDFLRDQVETFSKELDASPSGLLDDYPSQCYPGDVMAAVYCVRRADAVLGTDHSKFVTRAVRGFIGQHETKLKLPPYLADAKTGHPTSEARGCANSYFGLTAPELWPAAAKGWFQSYEQNFWQESLGFEGFREFPKSNTARSSFADVDSGPVVDGFGFAANAFGVGAARKNGRFDLAYPLSTEMISTIWELPDGTLLAPRLLSDLSDAPYLGEAAIMWLLSVPSEKGFPVKTGGGVPTFVYVFLGSASAIGLFMLLASLDGFRTALRGPEPWARAPGLQIAIWALLMAGAVALMILGHGKIGFILLLCALFVPRTQDKIREEENPVKIEQPVKK